MKKSMEKSNKSPKTGLANFNIFINFFVIMMLCTAIPDLDLELMIAKSLDFVKPKLFLNPSAAIRPICTYFMSESHLILKVFNISQVIEDTYKTLEDKHEEPFKSILKSLTAFSLNMIKSNTEDFQDLI